MARSVLRQRIDRDLARYLIRGERLVHEPVRQHWVSQLIPILAFVLALTAALWVDIIASPSPTGRLASNAAWCVFLAVGAWFLWRIFNWRHDWFVATDKRFLLFEGFIRRRVSMMPLIKVTDLTFDRSIVGRLFGYGAFRLESAGQEQSLSHLDYLPHADRLYHDICSVLFDAIPDTDDIRRAWDERDDDEDDGDSDEPWEPGPPRPPDGHQPLRPTATPPNAAPVGSPVATEPHHSRETAFDDDDHAAEAPLTNAVPSGRTGSAESIYRSADLVDDTDEIPIVPARLMPTRPRRKRRPHSTGEFPLYLPTDWTP